MLKLRTLLLTFLLILGCSFFLCTGILAAEEPEEPDGDSLLGESVSYTVTAEGVLIISGEGATYDFAVDAAPFASLAETVTAISVSDGITAIGSNTFLHLNASVITLPQSVSSIGDHAFGFASDGTAYVPIFGFTVRGYTGSEAETYASANGFSFEALTVSAPTGDCGPNLSWEITQEGVLSVYGNGTMVTFTSASEVPWSEYAAEKNGYRITSVVISDGITSISPFAFQNCRYLTDVSIPATVTNIGASAFEGCESLTSIVFPQSVTVLHDRVFASCLSLANVTLGNGITSIGTEAFYRTDLSAIDLPSVTEVGERAFYQCDKLESVSLPKVTVLTTAVFYGCSSLVPVDLGKLTQIADSAFEGCSSLSSFTLFDSLSEIGARAFYGCTSLESLRVPSSVASIGEYAFCGASSLSEITFRGSDPLILPVGVFENCSSLTDVSWGNRHVTEIHEYAFAGCGSFTVIELPRTVRIIQDKAFGYYAEDNSGEIETYEKYTGKSAPTFKAGIPSATQNYAVKHGFPFISRGLIELDTGDASPTATWKIEPELKKLTIEGSGALPDYDRFEDTPWFIYADYIEEVVVKNGITAIGSHAFHGCTALKKATLPGSVKSIGIYAFAETSLVRFEGAVGLLEIREYAFDNCKMLSEVSLPASLEQILDGAFRGNDLLTSVHIPESVNHIGETAFGYSSANKQNKAFVIKGTVDSMAYFHANQFGFVFLMEGTCEIKDTQSGASVLIKGDLDDSFTLSYTAIDKNLDSRYLFIGTEVIEKYRLSLLRDGLDIGYNGQAEIHLPVPTSMGEKAKVFIMTEDGAFLSVNATQSEGFLVFEGILGEFFLSDADLASLKALTVEHRYDNNTLIGSPKVFFAIPGASYYFEASVPDGYTTDRGILNGTMPASDLTLTFLYSKIVITEPPETTAPPVTSPDTSDTEPVSGGESDNGMLYVLLVVILIAILFAIVALILLNAKKKREEKRSSHSQKKSSDKFAHTMVIPDAPTQELDVHSLFSEEPEEDAEAIRKQRKKPAGKTGKRSSNKK